LKICGPFIFDRMVLHLVQLAHDKYLHDGLWKAGLKLNEGVDGSGQLILVYERFGGDKNILSLRIVTDLLPRILYASKAFMSLCIDLIHNARG
jgi:hypothetical protein